MVPQPTAFSPNKGSADGGSTVDSEGDPQRRSNPDGDNPFFPNNKPFTPKSNKFMFAESGGVPQELYDALKSKFSCLNI